MRQTDKAGNIGPVGNLTTAITLDKTAPAALNLTLAGDTGSSNSDGITNNGTINVGGLEGGATWQYSLDGGANWATGSGTSFDLAEEKTYEANQIKVRQTDKAGNIGPVGNLTTAITLDKTAPAALNLTLASDTGSGNSDGITNNATINVGNIEDGATWQYSLDGGANWATGSGTSFDLAEEKTYEANQIQVRQTDKAGNNSDIPAFQQIIFDQTKPTLLISDNKDGDALNSETVTLNFTFSENVYGFDLDDISLNQGSASNFSRISDKEYTVSLSNSTGGQQNITLNLSSVFDISGNGLETTTVSHTQNYTIPSPSTYDLGEGNGKLMSLVTVNGGNYYAWDKNGNGELSYLDWIWTSDLKNLLIGDGVDDNIWSVGGKELKLPSLGVNLTVDDTGWKTIDSDQEYEAGSLLSIIDYFLSVDGASSSLTSEGQPLDGWAYNNYYPDNKTAYYLASDHLNYADNGRSGVIVDFSTGSYSINNDWRGFQGVIWQVL